GAAGGRDLHDALPICASPRGPRPTATRSGRWSGCSCPWPEPGGPGRGQEGSAALALQLAAVAPHREERAEDEPGRDHRDVERERSEEHTSELQARENL